LYDRSRRLLLGDEAEPRGEVPPLLEAAAGTDGCHHRAGDDRADTRHGHQALAGGIVRSLHGLSDGLSIAEVVLVSLQERLDVLGGDQPNVVPEWLDLAGYVMRARTRPGLEAEKAGRQIDKPAEKLVARYITIAPRLSRPTRWKVFLPMSRPMVATGSDDR
jgi:hypothetical protein